MSSFDEEKMILCSYFAKTMQHRRLDVSTFPSTHYKNLHVNLHSELELHPLDLFPTI